jgi:hypothetical protein
MKAYRGVALTLRGLKPASIVAQSGTPEAMPFPSLFMKPVVVATIFQPDCYPKGIVNVLATAGLF